MSRQLINTSDQNYGAMDPAPNVAFLDFSPTEFYNLCQTIVSNIYTITSNAKSLEEAAKLLCSPSDSVQHREKIHVYQINTNQVISTTTKDLARLSMIVRRGDKQQKLQVDKLTNNFKDAVKKYSTLQQNTAKRMIKEKNVYIEDVTERTGYDGQSGEFDPGAESKALLVQREAYFQEQVVQELDRAVRQIENDVIDVNEVMKQLNALVVQQGEVVDTIESNIETATGNIEEGRSQLQTASRYQNKFRKKLCILLIIAIIVVCALIAILVSTLKK